MVWSVRVPLRLENWPSYSLHCRNSSMHLLGRCWGMLGDLWHGQGLIILLRCRCRFTISATSYTWCMRIDNRVATVTSDLTNGLARLLPRKVTNSRIRSTQSFDDLVEHGELILKCVIVIVLQRVELVESRWAHVERATNLAIHHLHLRRRQGAPPELISTVQRLSGVQRKLSVILLLARLA